MREYLLRGDAGSLAVSATDLARLRLLVGDSVDVSALHALAQRLPDGPLRASLQCLCAQEPSGARIVVQRNAEAARVAAR
jgi:hypothetical protein